MQGHDDVALHEFHDFHDVNDAHVDGDDDRRDHDHVNYDKLYDD